MWYVYALWNGNSIYKGMTNDLKRRFREHELGHTHSTKRMGKLELFYYEAFLSKKDAERKEKFYKTGYGREVLRDKLENTLIDLR